MKQHFIYLTTNLINNKKYIGKHYGEIDDDYIGSGTLLKKAIDKYGKENFNRIILHISKDGQDNNFWEKHYIREYNAVKSDEFYNISEGGDGGDIFHQLPIERQDQIKNLFKQKYSGEGNPMYGKHHLEETVEKLKAVDKNYTQTIEYRMNMSNAVKGNKNGMYGKHHSEESKQKMSNSKKGKKCGKENSNAKGIDAYADAEYTIFIKHFDTIQEALIFVGTKPNDYSGISKRMKENKPYKKYYWKKSVETNIEEQR